MHGGRLRRIGGTMVMVVGVAVIVALATGEVELVTTHGVSMLPRFHTGDLAIIIPSSQYHVGEIVGYKSPLLHITVLHRIVAEHAGLFTFKGDNNSFLDPVRLPASAIKGLLWARIPHGGVVLGWVRSPIGLALLAFFVVALVAGGTTRRRRTIRRAAGSPPAVARVGPGAESPPKDARPSLVPTWWGPVGVPLVLVGAFGLFATVAWSRPTTRPSTLHRSYRQHMAFSYEATAPAGVTYPTGSVVTGDPVFLRLVHTLDVTARYAFEATGAPAERGGRTAVSGTIGATAVLQGPGGWSGRLTTMAPVSFSGPTASVDVAVDLSQITALEMQFAQETGTSIGTANIAVLPTVDVHGSLDGAPVGGIVAPSLSLQMSGGELSLVSSSPGDGSAAFPQLTVDHTGSVSLPIRVPARLSLLGRSIDVAAARRLGLVGLALSFAAVLVGWFWMVRRRRMDEATLIRATYGDELIAVSASPAADAQLVVDVATFGLLAQLARRYECVILEYEHPGGHAYYVESGATVYRCGVDAAREPADLSSEESTLFLGDLAPVAVPTPAINAEAPGPGSSFRARWSKGRSAYPHLDPDTAKVATEVELLTGLAKAEWVSGVGNAADHLHQAVILARKAGLDQAMIEALLVNVRTAFDVAEDSDLEKIELLEHSLTSVGDRPALRARILGALAIELIFVDGSSNRGTILDEARDLADRSGDPLALADVAACHFLARPRAGWSATEFEADRARFGRALDEAVTLGDPRWVATMQSQAASYAFINGDGGSLRAHTAVLSETSAGGRNQVAQRALLQFGQAVATLEGSLVDAEALSVEGAELRRRTGLASADRIRATELLAIRREQGRMDEVMALLTDRAGARPASGAAAAALAFAMVESGCRHEAAVLLFRAECGGFGDIADDVEWPLAVAMWSEVAAQTGDVDCASTLHDILGSMDGLGMGSGGVSCGPASRLLAILEQGLGGPEDADRHFAEAIEFSRRLESPVWTARCQLDWAEAWTARGEALWAGQLIDEADAVMGSLVLPTLRQQSADLRHRPGR